MQQKALVIGAGFAGLSTACYLARDGYDVTILEKNNSPGGRARQYDAGNGFVFDMGPSWYWMPDVIEAFFNDFNKSASDYYTLKRLDPGYRVFFEKDQADVPASLSELKKLFESWESGSSNKLDIFLNQARLKYETGIGKLVHKPGLSWTEFMAADVLKGLLSLDLLNSQSAHIKKHFKDPRIIQLLEFPVLFLGAKPEKTPALYSLMNYADLVLGTWYPDGGMYSIVKGMTKLAKDLGVKILFDNAVTGFDYEQNRISAVRTVSGTYRSDVVVGSADYQHIDRSLLKETYSNYTEQYWNSRTLAPSSLIFYLGLNKRVKGMLHHNLFFDTDFTVHAQEIYDRPQWPSAPLFYTCVPSISDASVAPEGHENLFVLVPVAPGLSDTEEHRERIYQVVMKRMEEQTGQSLLDAVVYKRSYAHKEFIQDYNSFKGNAYGLANTLRQTAILKPSIKSKKLRNLYFAGQLTVPGPGVPPSLISGRIVGKLICSEQKHHS